MSCIAVLSQCLAGNHIPCFGEEGGGVAQSKITLHNLELSLEDEKQRVRRMKGCGCVYLGVLLCLADSGRPMVTGQTGGAYIRVITVC